jgi:hypothetical protein
MISFERAKALAEETVAGLAAANGGEFALVHDETVEVNEGWLFFYNSREFIETGDISFALVGNGPIFVNRGEVVRRLPTAVPWDLAIRSP